MKKKHIRFESKSNDDLQSTFPFIGKSLSDLWFDSFEPKSRLNVFSSIGKSLNHLWFNKDLPKNQDLNPEGKEGSIPTMQLGV